MTSLSRRDVERKLDALDEGDGEAGDPPEYVLLDELKEGTYPPGTPPMCEMLSGVAKTELLVDVRDGDENAENDREDDS